MPVASGTARTRFTQLALYSQRYSSFAGKTAAVVQTSPSYTYTAEWRTMASYTASFQATKTYTAEWD